MRIHRLSRAGNDDTTQHSHRRPRMYGRRFRFFARRQSLRPFDSCGEVARTDPTYVIGLSTPAGRGAFSKILWPRTRIRLALAKVSCHRQPVDHTANTKAVPDRFESMGFPKG